MKRVNMYKQLMGGAPRTYACIQISEVEIPFTAKVGSWEIYNKVHSYTKLQQIHHQDLLFADFIIADITSVLKICLFTEMCLAQFTRYTV